MAAAGELSGRVNAAIVTDEIGIEAGRYGPFLLKTAYQAIFHNTPEGLLPCGVTGSARAYREGRPVAWQSFLDQVPTTDREFVDRLSRVLQLHNHRNIGVDGLVLHYGLDADLLDDPLEQIEQLSRTLVEVELDPALLVCELPACKDENRLAEPVKALRHHRIRIAVDDFGSDQAAAVRIRILDPQIVKLDGSWFRRIAEVPTASRLLNSLVDALQREGRQVMIAGVETAEHLRVALDTGADLMLGGFLREPMLAGVIFETELLDIGKLLGTGEKVVPLFAGRNHSV